MAIRQGAVSRAAKKFFILLSLWATYVDSVAQEKSGPESLAVKIRTAIIRNEFLPDPLEATISQPAPTLTPQTSIRTHGVKEFQSAIIELMRDRDENVRKMAAETVMIYGLPAGHLSSALREMLTSDDHWVQLAGVKLASNAQLFPELIVPIALQCGHPFRQQAIECLRPFLSETTPDPVALQAINTLLAPDADLNSVGMTLETLERLGPMAKFAESKTAELLGDCRQYRCYDYAHTEPNHFLNVQAMRVLRNLGSVSAETEVRIHQVVDRFDNERSIHGMQRSRLELWGEGALALAVLEENDVPIQNLMNLLMRHTDEARIVLSPISQELLRIKPMAMIRWSHGREIVGSMLISSVDRSVPSNWRVVLHWTQGADVFRPEINAYFRDGFSKPHASCFRLVCELARQDGLSYEEAAAIIEYATQSPSNSTEIQSALATFSQDGEATRMLLAAISIVVDQSSEADEKTKRAFELRHSLLPGKHQ
ncbi:MAG: HEAT repeat domain-containing protein [Planctomyces sp.]|nr:HEAT repeat domain-containing protein [Planctomyces sp.]